MERNRNPKPRHGKKPYPESEENRRRTRPNISVSVVGRSYPPVAVVSMRVVVIFPSACGRHLPERMPVRRLLGGGWMGNRERGGGEWRSGGRMDGDLRDLGGWPSPRVVCLNCPSLFLFWWVFV